jgi:hypothetical protein
VEFAISHKKAANLIEAFVVLAAPEGGDKHILIFLAGFL